MGLSCLFLDARDVAETALRGELSFRGGQAIVGEFRFALFEMETHFLGHFGFGLLAAKKITETAE